jgi:tetratricopeptide (TPR) repeat protein
MPTIHELVDAALAVQKRGDFSAAIVAFRDILQREPDNRAALFGQAFCLQALGEIEAAIGAYRAITVIDPFLSESFINLSGLLEDQGRGAEAIAALQACLRTRPNNPEIWHRLGGMMQRAGDLLGAEGAFRKAWDQLPQNPDYGVALATLLNQRGEAAAATAVFQDVMTRHPASAAAYIAQGVAAQNRGDLQQAATWYDRAIKVDPKTVEARLNLASLLEANGQIQAAQQLRREAFRERRLFVEPVNRRDLPRILALEAPEGGFPSTSVFPPHEFQLTRLVLMEGQEALPPALPPQDLVVVALPAGDHPLLAMADQVIARLGLPVITPPDKARHLTRAEVRARAAGIDRLRTLVVTRVAAHDLASSTFPVWARPVGLTSVRQWVLLPTAEAAEQVQTQLQLAEYDATPVPSLASPDGVLRIYRMVAIGSELLPYRLLASRASMVDPSGQMLLADDRLRTEETVFLTEPNRAPTGIATDALHQFLRKLDVDVALLDVAMDGPEAVVVDVHMAPPLDGPWRGALGHRAGADAAITAAIARLVAAKRSGQ